MRAYFLRRLLLVLPTLIGITLLVFAITRMLPGGPIAQMILELEMGSDGEGSGGRTTTGVVVSEDLIRELRAHYHLDQPLLVAYWLWLKDLATFNLGKSHRYNVPVTELIVARLPISSYFGLIGFLLAYGIAVPLGILKAVRHSGVFDGVSSALIFIGYSIPGWALGLLLLFYFGGHLGWLPLDGFQSEHYHTLDWFGRVCDRVRHTILPVAAYAMGSFAALTLLMKNSLLDQLGQEYVRTAFAKGLSERGAILRHALRNSLIPLATGLGHAVSFLLAGSYLVERIFNIDGIGYLGFKALEGHDYPVVMGILVINAALMLVGNILSDLLYVVIDPRIRFTSG
ncbi:MAG: ABC transporter permease subunit [Planctomycetota bacterium]